MVENVDNLFETPQNSEAGKLQPQQVRKILVKSVLPNAAVALLALGIGIATPYLICMKLGAPFSLKDTWITLIPGFVFLLRVFWRLLDLLNGKVSCAEGVITILTPPSSRSRDGSFEINRKIIFVDKKLCRTKLQDRKKYRVVYLPISKLALSIQMVDE
jgi:hypothetical protein